MNFLTIRLTTIYAWISFVSYIYYLVATYLLEKHAFR